MEASEISTAAMLWQLCYTGFARATMLGWLCYSSYAAATMLQQLVYEARLRWLGFAARLWLLKVMKSKKKIVLSSISTKHSDLKRPTKCFPDLRPTLTCLINGQGVINGQGCIFLQNLINGQGSKSTYSKEIKLCILQI